MVKIRLNYCGFIKEISVPYFIDTVSVVIREPDVSVKYVDILDNPNFEQETYKSLKFKYYSTDYDGTPIFKYVKENLKR